MSQVSISQALAIAKQQQQAGNLADAERMYEQILLAEPNQADAVHFLGVIRLQTQNYSEALALIDRSIALNPAAAFYHSNRAQALAGLQRLNEAVDAYALAIAINPHFVEAHYNLGNALRRLRRFADALASYRRALQLQPNHGNAQLNLAGTLSEMGDYEASAAEYERAPQTPEARFNRGLCLLLLGDLKRGFEEFEFRTQSPSVAPHVQHFPQPQWRGEDLAGKRIFLHAEHGIGDTIHMARYIPLVAQRGATVLLQCQPSLVEWMKTVDGLSPISTRADPLPAFDLHCQLLSIPLAMRTTLDSIPSTVPYLPVDPARAEIWKKRLRELGDAKKVGLCWAGSKAHPNDHNRSANPGVFSMLRDMPNVQFVSLQKEPRNEDRPELVLADFTKDLHSFADTAALIAQLDLLITVDTSVAHVAGAIGRPVWVMLSFRPDWRWLVGRDDSPWYPTMKLFRQTRVNDWTEPMQKIANELRRLF